MNLSRRRRQVALVALAATLFALALVGVGPAQAATVNDAHETPLSGDAWVITSIGTPYRTEFNLANSCGRHRRAAVASGLLNEDCAPDRVRL